MPSEIQHLIKRLKIATAFPGMKGKLAADMKVPRPRVSEWLTGKKEPGGDTTLRLLKWVERQERAK